MAVETNVSWRVTWYGNREDWLVDFAKTPTVDAARWARELVRAFNARAAAAEAVATSVKNS